MKSRNPIRLGMVGGGKGAFIGEVHRTASKLDGKYILCAGALSSDPRKSIASGKELGLDEDRIYETFEDMILKESRRDDSIEAVSIVTPNNTHFPIAQCCLDAGLHVICDKPFTLTSAQADQLIEKARKQNLVLAVTYNYSGYPMVRQARAMIRDGEIGKIRIIQAEYAQGWLSQPIERDGHKQALWRTDPERSGMAGCVGDIGTHAYHLICFTSGLTPKSLCADVSTFVEGRKLDDNANILLRFDGNATGMIWTSQVAIGNNNGLKLRIFGDKGGIEWDQEHPNELIFSPLNQPSQKITTGSPNAKIEASSISRLPPGHPEGYLEAFANLYTEIADSIMDARVGRFANTHTNTPSGYDGKQGAIFVESVIRSSSSGSIWVNL